MPQSEGELKLPDFNDVLQGSEQILQNCFKQFSIDEVFLSFNGGKDCTALLDITINVLKNIYKRNDIANELKVVYIRTKGPFKEIEDFAKLIEGHYGIKLRVVEGSLKEAVNNILEDDKRLKACLMGTRKTDPYSSDLTHMQYTDPGWPKMMRVSPLLDWSYNQIWSYILSRKVPYCSLYDRGYTSIGSVHNTCPNPSLAYKDNTGKISYHPAWLLTDEAEERAGRGVNCPNGIQANGTTTNGTNGTS